MDLVSIEKGKRNDDFDVNGKKTYSMLMKQMKQKLKKPQTHVAF